MDRPPLTNACPAAGSAPGGRQTGGSPTDHEHIERQAPHIVTTLIPSSHTVWQLKECARPSIVTRHSKQMPMPHKGARASPCTDRRYTPTPAFAIAAATMVPAGA